MLAEQGNGDNEGLNVVPDDFVELASNEFRSAECYERRRLVGSLTGTTAHDVQFEEGRFSSVDLSKTRWKKLLLRKTWVEKCDLANARWADCVVEGTEFDRCRATGLQFVDSRSLNSKYRRCKLNLTAFHGSKFRDDEFENCDLREAIFEGVELANVKFRNCDLRLARFPNCAFERVDFRGSLLAGVQIDPMNLRGTCINAAQLLNLAGTVGLIVKEADVD